MDYGMIEPLYDNDFVANFIQDYETATILDNIEQQLSGYISNDITIQTEQKFEEEVYYEIIY